MPHYNYYEQHHHDESSEEGVGSSSERSVAIMEKLKKEKERKRSRWLNYQFPDILLGNVFFFTIAGLVVFVVSMILSGCDRSYLPWNRGRVEQPSTGEEDFGPEWGGTAGSSGTNPHERPTAAPAPSTEGAAVESVVRPYPAGVMEDWCVDLEDDIAKWRRYLNPSYDWSHEDSRFSEPSRRASVISNLRGLVEQWDRVCANGTEQ